MSQVQIICRYGCIVYINWHNLMNCSFNTSFKRHKQSEMGFFCSRIYSFLCFTHSTNWNIGLLDVLVWCRAQVDSLHHCLHIETVLLSNTMTSEGGEMYFHFCACRIILFSYQPKHQLNNRGSHIFSTVSINTTNNNNSIQQPCQFMSNTWQKMKHFCHKHIPCTPLPL